MDPTSDPLSKPTETPRIVESPKKDKNWETVAWYMKAGDQHLKEAGYGNLALLTSGMTLPLVLKSVGTPSLVLYFVSYPASIMICVAIAMLAKNILPKLASAQMKQGWESAKKNIQKFEKDHPRFPGQLLPIIAFIFSCFILRKSFKLGLAGTFLSLAYYHLRQGEEGDILKK